MARSTSLREAFTPPPRPKRASKCDKIRRTSRFLPRPSQRLTLSPISHHAQRVMSYDQLTLSADPLGYDPMDPSKTRITLSGKLDPWLHSALSKSIYSRLPRPNTMTLSEAGRLRKVASELSKDHAAIEKSRLCHDISPLPRTPFSSEHQIRAERTSVEPADESLIPAFSDGFPDRNDGSEPPPTSRGQCETNRPCGAPFEIICVDLTRVDKVEDIVPVTRLAVHTKPYFPGSGHGEIKFLD